MRLDHLSVVFPFSPLFGEVFCAVFNRLELRKVGINPPDALYLVNPAVGELKLPRAPEGPLLPQLVDVALEEVSERQLLVAGLGVHQLPQLLLARLHQEHHRLYVRVLRAPDRDQLVGLVFSFRFAHLVELMPFVLENVADAVE
jgi:hypothetical protein